MSNRKIVGVCYAGVGEEYQSKIINSMFESAKNMPDLRLLFFTCYSDNFSGSGFDMGEAKIFKLINYEMLDALLILSETIKSHDVLYSLINQAHAHNVPVISFDLKIDGCYSIVFDDRTPINEIVKHLANVHGCRHINFLTGDLNQEISCRRAEAYRQAIEECGLEYDEKRLGEGMWWDIPSQNVTREWLKSGMEIDAIVCANDVMAMAVMDELKSSGLSVPGDIIVTGIDNLIEGQYHIPRLTTARICHEESMKKALEILDVIFSGGVPDDVYEFGAVIKYSESCGCTSREPRDINRYNHEYITKIDRMNMFNQQMFRMNASLIENASINTVIEKLKPIVSVQWTKKLWICVNENYFGISENSERIASHDLPSQCFSSNMEVIAFKDNEQIGGNEFFPISKLVPDFENQIDECKYIQFIPLHANNEIIGYIAKEHAWNYNMQEWFSFALNISNSLATIRQQMQLRHMISKLQDMYIRDSMTNLFNRRGFYQKLHEASANNKTGKLMVISIDLDRLKSINDMYGHAEGDFAIIAVAKSLLSVSIKGEICARFGGDEFIVVGIVSDDEYCTEYENRFYSYLDYFNKHSEKPYVVKASFGLVVGADGVYDNIEELIRLADEKMYLNKASKGNNRSNM